MGRLFFILGVIISTLVVGLVIAGVIHPDVASDTLGRSLGIVALLGFAASVIMYVADAKKNKSEKNHENSDQHNQGPKF